MEQKIRKTLEDIKDTDSLIEYLKYPYYGFSSAYHYTSLEALYKIFKYKTLRFSRMSAMNDSFERELFCDNKDFFFCLSKGKEDIFENFGMWSMYGKLNNSKTNNPTKIGVKIYFSKENLLRLLAENKEIIPHSVAYANIIENYENPKNLKVRVGSHTANISDFDIKKHSGFLKDTAWKYENELRLRIPCTTERLTDKTKDIPISEGILGSLKIYPSPIYDCDTCKKIFLNLNKGEGLIPKFENNVYRQTLKMD